MLVAYTPTSPQSKLMHLADARLFTHFFYGASLPVFLCGVRWRHSKSPNSEPHFLVNFYQFEDG